VNGAQTTVEPTPFASLAPTAVYRIGAFAAGGPIGAGDVGESVSPVKKSQPARPDARTPTMMMRATVRRVSIRS
jgi:hypothetical protein